MKCKDCFRSQQRRKWEMYNVCKKSVFVHSAMTRTTSVFLHTILERVSDCDMMTEAKLFVTNAKNVCNIFNIEQWSLRSHRSYHAHHQIRFKLDLVQSKSVDNPTNTILYRVWCTGKTSTTMEWPRNLGQDTIKIPNSSR